jgi:hypothetical protein
MPEALEGSVPERRRKVVGRLVLIELDRRVVGFEAVRGQAEDLGAELHGRHASAPGAAERRGRERRRPLASRRRAFAGIGLC